ncbi:U4/U5/U6 small nuclear ribonucleoprotein prp3 [Thecaphora frezii]
MPPKRPLRNVFGEAEDDDESGSASAASPKPGIPPKRPRTGAQPSSLISSITSASSAAAPGAPAAPSSAAPGSIQAQIEAARARIQAQMSSLGTRPGTARPPPPPLTASAAQPPAPPPAFSAAAAAARPSATATSARPAAATAPASFDEIQKKVAEAKARLQAMQKSGGFPASMATAPRPLSATTTSVAPPKPAPAPAPARAEPSKPPTGIHPLLLGDGDVAKFQEQVRSSAPKFASVQANARPSSSASGRHRSAGGRGAVPVQANPYLADLLAAAAGEGASDEAKPKVRSMRKGFAFHRPGRHIQEAEEARREAQMEELKRRIQESARKAGMQDDLTGDERLLQRQAPPEVEWWDVALLPNKSYDDVPDDQDVAAMLEKAKAREDVREAAGEAAVGGVEGGGPLFYGAGSPIDPYIQHPIPIPAPSHGSGEVKPLGVMLTKKEMKKMRRQRRAAEQQDKRDRIKMGLLPPDPPKVKLSNLMRVLTSEAVADPTKVEARVRREIAARKEAHLRANEERKLTPEQKREKAKRKVEADEAKGLFCQVYRVKRLGKGWQLRKVRMGIMDYHLTGVVVVHPAFSLVVVEGASKGIKGFHRLMTVRIHWTEKGDPVPASDSSPPGEGGVPSAALANDEDPDATFDWSTNKCELIFQGPVRRRAFANGFRVATCPNDKAARETLGEMEGVWDVAKRFVDPNDEGV